MEQLQREWKRANRNSSTIKKYLWNWTEQTGVEYGEMRCEHRGEKEKEKGETCHKKCQTKLSSIDQSLSLIPWTN